MRVKHSLLAVLVLLLVGSASALPTGNKYEDPDAPEVEAAARQALPRAVVRPIAGEVRDVIGITPAEEATAQETGVSPDEGE